MATPSQNSIAELCATLAGVAIIGCAMAGGSIEMLFATGLSVVWIGMLSGMVNSAFEVQGQLRYACIMIAVMLGTFLIWLYSGIISEYVQSRSEMVTVLVSAVLIYAAVYGVSRVLICRRIRTSKTGG